jgi:hypothetical protein
VSNRGLLSRAKKELADSQVFEISLITSALEVGSSVANADTLSGPLC